jgi:hypothetical protein
VNRQASEVAVRTLALARMNASRAAGLSGRIAGWVRACRASNHRRNAWAVSLLDVQRDDRAREIGFGAGDRDPRARPPRRRRLSVRARPLRGHGATAPRRNAEAVRRGQVELRLGRAENLPALEPPFDKILAVNALQFWDQP